MKRVLFTLLITLVLTPLAFGDGMKTKVDSLRPTLGTAVGKERSAARGGRVQEFEKGAIYWSPKTGAHLVKSDVLTKYKSLGAEKGKLGYPVGDERSNKKGMRQTFEHGFLRTTGGGDLTADILGTATLTEGTVTLGPSSGVLMGIDDGTLTIRETSGPDIVLSCSCEQNPQPFSQRLGICTLTISKSRKTATCRTKDCNGTCGFESTSK